VGIGHIKHPLGVMMLAKTTISPHSIVEGKKNSTDGNVLVKASGTAS